MQGIVGGLLSEAAGTVSVVRFALALGKVSVMLPCHGVIEWGFDGFEIGQPVQWGCCRGVLFAVVLVCAHLE
jgi:hypothetical protein